MGIKRILDQNFNLSQSTISYSFLAGEIDRNADEALSHTAAITVGHLDRKFKRVISKRPNALQNADSSPWDSWAHRSPDLTPLDFFLWGHLKSQVYCYPLPRNKQELSSRITREFHLRLRLGLTCRQTKT